MNLHPNRRSGLAFLPALILFVIILAIAGAVIIMLAQAANRLMHQPGPPVDGNTNYPPITFLPIGEIPHITAADLATLAAMATNTTEIEFFVMRSTNLVDWQEVVRSNTVNHQALWDDPDKPYPNAFYQTFIVLPHPIEQYGVHP